MSEKEVLLDVTGLKTYFYTEDGVVMAVDGIDFEMYPGETLGLLGESGCGKSVTSLSILQLVPSPPGKIIEGSIQFKGEDLLEKNEREMRKIRGREISMIFQDPMTCLNPVFNIGNQLMETIRLHQNLDKKEAKKSAIRMLEMVGIPDAKSRIDDFPHQFSGGQRQRIMIAIALSCNPSLLIADEPTTALDVTIQAQVLDLMRQLKKEWDTSILYITHNMGVVAEMADRVAVMYAGNIVEMSIAKRVFGQPLHPYTSSLLRSIPRIDRKIDRLEVIRGVVPNLITPPLGCRFHPRCKYMMKICSEEKPPYLEPEPGHKVMCWLYAEGQTPPEDLSRPKQEGS